MPGTVTLIDAFTAADGVGPPTSWLTVGGIGSSLRTISNSVTADSTSTYSESYDNRGATAADAGRCFTVVGTPNDGDAAVIRLRLANPGSGVALDGYEAVWFKASGDDTFVIRRDDNNVQTDIATISTGFNLSTGDLFLFEAVGSTLTIYLSTDSGANWTTVLTTSDATYSAAGHASLGIYRQGARADDWSDVDVSSGPVLGSFSLTGTVTVGTAGNVRRYGSASLTATVSADTTSHRRAKGAVSLTETVTTATEGERTAKGAFSLTETVSTDIESARTAKGALSLTETVNIDTAGVGTGNLKLGSASLTATVTIATAGNRTAYGALALTETVTASTVGDKSARGSFALTLTVNIATDGGIPVTFFPVGTTGRIARPIAGRIARPLAGRIQT